MPFITIDFLVPDEKQREILRQFISDYVNEGNNGIRVTSRGVNVFKFVKKERGNLLIFNGSGKNGKTTMINQISHIDPCNVFFYPVMNNACLIKQAYDLAVFSDLSGKLCGMFDNYPTRCTNTSTYTGKCLKHSTTLEAHDLINMIKTLLDGGVHVIVKRNGSVDPLLAEMGAVIEFPYCFPERLTIIRKLVETGLLQHLPKDLVDYVGEFYARSEQSNRIIAQLETLV